MRSHRSQRIGQDLVVAFSVTLVALACAGAGAPGAALATPLLPDVVSDAPEADGAPDVQDDGQGARLLLRLDGFVHNAGRGALEIRGANPSNRVMGTVRQRVYDSVSGFQDIGHAPAPSLIYETNDEHRHWHLMHAMRYSLWSEDRSVEVAPVQKVGFCLEDSESVESWASDDREYTSANFCAWGNDQASSVVMGVSAGWRDVYGSRLAFQWVDITDTAPGRYWLRADADPDGVIAESDEVNPPAYESDMSIVDGHRADPVAAGPVPALGSTPITLAATTFADRYGGSLGPRQFQIVTPPAGGTLDRPTGTWFSAGQVRYTPKPGFSGPDTFTFAARDASSPFPRTPPSAAVTLTVAGSAQGTLQAQSTDAAVLGISGAPRSVYTSSTTRLRATGPGVAQGVTWSASAGKISASGVYRAPASVPRGGTVTISARSATGASGKVTIRVRAKPRRRAAPGIKAPPPPKHGLSKIRLGRHSRSLIAAVSSAQSGRVRFTMKRDGKPFGSCSMVVRKRGSATCTARVPARISRLNLVCLIPRTVGLKLPGVTVTATLIRHGRVVAKRYASAR
jgi:Lysyl oxidase/Bacterial Ig domain